MLQKSYAFPPEITSFIFPMIMFDHFIYLNTLDQFYKQEITNESILVSIIVAFVFNSFWQDKAFGSRSPVIISNPPVESIITTLQTYSKYDIYSAYDGHDFFWGGNPKEGDLIDFLFDTPIKLSK